MMKNLQSRLGAMAGALLFAGSLACATANPGTDYRNENSNRKVVDCVPIVDLITENSFACSEYDGKQWLIEIDEGFLAKASFWKKGDYEQAVQLLKNAGNEGTYVRVVGLYNSKDNTISGREVWFGDEMYPLK